MGQAFYGAVRLKVSGPVGTRVEMRTSFNLRPDGLLKTENDRSARNKDIYILSGHGAETWSPRFRGNAYRFIQVSGFPGTPTLENFEGLVLHTDMEPVGTFSCSNPLINQIYSNTRWGTRMQNRSTPMDPDRDERQGWSGHPAKTSESEAFVYNVASFYSNWLKERPSRSTFRWLSSRSVTRLLDIQFTGHNLACHRDDHSKLVLRFLWRLASP